MLFVDPAASHARLCLRAAGRINVALQHELGQGIDVQRMVDEPLYARDVLLVCDALRGHAAGGASALAQQFRQAAASAAQPPGASRSNGGLDSGFSASRFLSSIFGPLAPREAPVQRRRDSAAPRPRP